MDTPDLARFSELLNDLAKLYQFRPVDDRLYGSLTVSQSYCLRELYFHGSKTMGELARDLDVRFSTMTGIADQLYERGLVERVQHPDDRRSIQVALTPVGRRTYEAAHAAFLSHLAPLLSRRDAAARRKIADFLEELIGMIRTWRARARAARPKNHPRLWRPRKRGAAPQRAR